MKKVLLTVAALTLSAGFAFAEEAAEKCVIVASEANKLSSDVEVMLTAEQCKEANAGDFSKLDDASKAKVEAAKKQ